MRSQVKGIGFVYPSVELEPRVPPDESISSDIFNEEN